MLLRATVGLKCLVFDYLAAIDTDVVRCARERGWQSSTQAVLPGHVRMWTLSRASLVYGADWGI